MNDPRAIIAGILAAIALMGGVILTAIGADAQQTSVVLGLASTFGAYVVGLYSKPMDDSK